MRLNCAIFDMDGTLLDSMWKWDALGIELLRRHGREPRADFRDVTIPMGIWSAARYCVEEYGLDCAPEDLVEEMNTTMMDFYAGRSAVKRALKSSLPS